MKEYKLLKRFLFFILLSAFLFISAGCGPKIAFRQDYDFSRIQRVGVIKFDSNSLSYSAGSDPGSAVADEFIFQFLNRGVKVVERSRLQTILREHNLWKGGDIDPNTIKKMGHILGVDALVMGTVTRFVPDKKERIYVRDPSGNVQEEIFLVEAEVGISARMVDVETGEVVWASSYIYDSFYVDTAIRQAVSAILNSLSDIWL